MVYILLGGTYGKDYGLFGTLDDFEVLWAFSSKEKAEEEAERRRLFETNSDDYVYKVEEVGYDKS